MAKVPMREVPRTVRLAFVYAPAVTIASISADPVTVVAVSATATIAITTDVLEWWLSHRR